MMRPRSVLQINSQVSYSMSHAASLYPRRFRAAVNIVLNAL